MADRVLRGSRLGSVSYESDRDADLAPRQLITFDCPAGPGRGPVVPGVVPREIGRAHV